MLRHFSRATDCFSKLSFVEASESHEKEPPRQTRVMGQFMLKRFVECGLVFPNHNASIFDLFSSNPQHPLKASNFSKAFQPTFRHPPSMRCHPLIEITHAPCLGNIYPLSICHFLLNSLKFRQQLHRVHQKKGALI